MEIEKQRGISVASSVMQMEYRDCVINLLDTPGHQDFSRRHLPRADRGGRGADGDRRGQRRRAADAAAAAGLPRAQHADPDLRQQDGPRGAGAAGADGRDRARAGHGGRALHLAGGHGQALPRRDGPARAAHARVRARRGPQPRRQTRSSTAWTTRSTRSASAPSTSTRDTTSSWCATPRRPSTRQQFLAGQQTPMFFGSAINNFGVREVLDALVDLAPPPGERAAIQRVVQPDEAQVHRRGVQDPGQHGPGAPRPHRLRARGLAATSSAACA